MRTYELRFRITLPDSIAQGLDDGMGMTAALEQWAKWAAVQLFPWNGMLNVQYAGSREITKPRLTRVK